MSTEQRSDGKACGLCGCDPACGHAFAGEKLLCHTDDHSCYHRWTVYGDRPAATDAVMESASRAAESMGLTPEPLDLGPIRARARRVGTAAFARRRPGPDDSEAAAVTLVEFLLERIAEDEAAARGLMGATRVIGRDPDFNSCGGPAAEGYWAHFVPFRMLAECESKRLITEWHSPSPELHDGYDRFCVGCWEEGGQDGAPTYPCRTARLLALPYADREGYDEAWRP